MNFFFDRTINYDNQIRLYENCCLKLLKSKNVNPTQVLFLLRGRQGGANIGVDWGLLLGRHPYANLSAKIEPVWGLHFHFSGV